MTETQFPAFRKLYRIACWPVRHWRIFAIIAVVLVIVHTVADQLLLRKLAAQREAMRTESVAVSFADFRFPRLSDADNAAVAYRYIATQIRYPQEDEEGFEELRHRMVQASLGVDATSGEQDAVPLSDEEWRLVGEYVALNGDTYQMLRKAQLLPGCQFGDYDSPLAIEADPGSFAPQLAHVRQLGRHLAVRSAWEHHQGHTREAYEWTVTGLHLANDLSSDPLLIAGMVRVACAGIALGNLQAMMCEDDLPDPLPDGLVAELEMLADRTLSARFPQGEACFMNGKSVSTNFQTPGPILRTPNQIAVNDLLLKFVRAAREEDYAKREAMLAQLRELMIWPGSESPVARERMVARGRKVKGKTGTAKPGTRKTMMEKKGIEGVMKKKGKPSIHVFRWHAELLAPGLLRAQDALERPHAQANGAILAIALKQYKRDRGAYPDELAALAPEYVQKMPQDPFCGEPFRYRREADGFVLYSIGEDRMDNGGQAIKGAYIGDLVWRAVR